MLRTSLWVTCSLTALILALAGCGSPPPVEPESLKAVRPSYDGYYLAVPATPMPKLPRQVVQSLRQITLIGLDFEIGKNGRVRGIRPIDSVLSVKWDELSAALRQIQFFPGRIQDRPVKQTLRATLILGPEKYQRKIIFPVDSSGRVSDPDLYWQGMMMNSVAMPSLDRCPSYFLDIDAKDSVADLNYLLVRLDLDSSGRVTSYETIHSDAGRFTDQIIDALNWANYTVPNTSADSTRSVYLRIALYNMVPYPTIELEFPLDSLSLLERERVKLFPDTVGLMFKPIPSRYQADGVYSIHGEKLTIADTLMVMISIGVNGVVTSFSSVGSYRTQKYYYLKLAQWLRFYPARSFSGEARGFSGIARLEYVDITHVRIRFLWLPGEGEIY